MNNQQHQDKVNALAPDSNVLEPNDIYTIDAPVNNPEQDKFKRWSFSQRVAQTIASRNDPSSLVIGIYGPWGDGKTTVLNFIERNLKESDEIICVKFNPWRFTDEASLIKGFFQALAEAIGKSIASHSEEVGKWLDKYSSGLGLNALTFNFGVVRVNLGQGIQAVGKGLSSVELEELKKRIESLLKNEGKRVVVLMDDIDRLDKNEIQAVFKLVKLSADFDYTAYVLAFDEEMVASALSERYGSGDIKAGRNFLEKIIQVPLNLPKADRVALLEYCMVGIEEVLKDANIQISEEQFRYHFLNHFIDGLEIRVKTPRMVKRYINALAFSLPILKGEVNYPDLMLIEGMRLFYPALYEVVKNNPDIFSVSPFTYNGEDYKKRSLEIINKGIQGLTTDEEKSAKNLLKALFPCVNQTLGNSDYVSNGWRGEWDIDQRASSSHYFSRFFSYSISDHDISDQELTSFLSQIQDNSVETTISNIHQIVGDQRADLFILKLNSRIEKLSSSSSQNLALAISLSGDIFSKEKTFLSRYLSSAEILIGKLVENISDDQIKVNVAKQIVLDAKPISFAIKCFRCLVPLKEREEIERHFSVDQERIIGEAFSQRIKEISQISPLYIQFPEDFSSLLYVWSHWGDKEEVKKYLLEALNQNPKSVVEFLKCYLPTLYSLPDYRARKWDFERNQYNSLAEYIEPSLIYQLLQNIYGSKLDNPEYYESDNQQRSLDEKVVSQFAFIHQFVIEEVGSSNN
ncbi:P-loop NTPase fold protein [Kamptonema sp. UHCC 0994]|uniref:KAP family P-loop NTPase fold protein n=1 Tax=Kamptonema sp. UHCC 0994 TaxID=3031329 RepID=UPI0023BA8AA6|nr:P-loop NTPase fold protein [Kamptonema sp. UHCC 0994]MDF0556870.1 P-loop NTPase fold protein [Kamptonema sp. UHCC 0994]